MHLKVFLYLFDLAHLCYFEALILQRQRAGERRDAVFGAKTLLGLLQVFISPSLQRLLTEYAQAVDSLNIFGCLLPLLLLGRCLRRLVVVLFLLRFNGASVYSRRPSLSGRRLLLALLFGWLLFRLDAALGFLRFAGLDSFGTVMAYIYMQIFG